MDYLNPDSASGVTSLAQHDARSCERAKWLGEKLDKLYTQKGDTMGMDNLSDKINVNVGGEGSGGGMGPAMIAALLNGRNQDSSLAPLMGMMSGGGGFGGNNAIWPIVLLALLGRGRGGLFGGDGGDCGGGGAENRIEDTVFNTAVLNKLGTIEAGQGLVGAQTENVILQQTNALTNLANQNLLAINAGTDRTRDSVQSLALALSQAICGVNQNVSAQGCMTREAVENDGDKTRAMLSARFQLEDQTRIQNQAAEIIELREEGRRRASHDELKLQITNTNTAVAAQAQGQAQAQQQEISNSIRALFPLIQGVLQVAHATNSNVIAGNTAAVVTGPQTANPTNVNA